MIFPVVRILPAIFPAISLMYSLLIMSILGVVILSRATTTIY